MFFMVVNMCNMSLYEGTKIFNCKKKKKKKKGILEMQSFLSIINLPPTPNSYVCSFIAYISLLLLKKKMFFIVITFLSPFLLSSLSF